MVSPRKTFFDLLKKAMQPPATGDEKTQGQANPAGYSDRQTR